MFTTIPRVSLTWDHFYAQMSKPHQGLSPDGALKQCKQWVKDATAVAYLVAFAKEESDEQAKNAKRYPDWNIK